MYLYLWGQIALLIGIMGFASCKTSDTVETVTQQDLRMDESVKEADLIVVARVIGIIDTKPAASVRKDLQAHWIRVERTLKGVDETGQRLRARPDGMLWKDGQSYILFLKRLGGDSVESTFQQLIEATQASIAAIAEEVTAQGAGVSPKRLLWMKYVGGWGGGLIAEFFVTVDGDFEWKQRLQTGNNVEPEYEQLVRV